MTDERQENFEEERAVSNLPAVVDSELTEPERLVHMINGRMVPPAALAALEAMNEKHALVVRGGREFYLERIDNPAPHELPYQFVHKPALKALYQNASHITLMQSIRTRNGHQGWEPVSRPLLPTWCEWPGRRTYRRVGFYPGHEAPADVFNLWEGWRIKPRKGQWGRLLKHIYVVICRSEPRKFKWLINWLSHLFQTTGDADRRSPVSPVIWGRKGSGKSILFEYIKMCFGNHGITVARKEQLTGKFNQHLMMCLFLIAEEAVFAYDKLGEGPLKDFLTRRTQTVEPKGVDAFEAPNYCRAAFLSNEKLAVPMTDDERRYQPFEVSDQHVGDASWFEAIADEMKNGGLEAMFYDLSSRKYDEKLIRTVLNDDADLSAMLARIITPPVRFALHWFHNGHVVLTRRGDDLPSVAGLLEDTVLDVRPRSQVLALNEDTNFVPSAELKGAYDQWCRESLDVHEQRKSPRTTEQLVKELRKAFSFIQSDRTKRQRGVNLPSTATSKAEVATKRTYKAYLDELDPDDI